MGQDRLYETSFIGHPDGLAANLLATVTPTGYLRAEVEPTALFYDPFDTPTGLDTTIKWITSGTAAPAIATGALQLTSSTTASASSAINTRPVFLPQGLNFLGLGGTLRFENASSTVGAAFYTGSHRFFGFGTIPTTWVAAYSASSTSGPLAYGIGFEIDTDGLMYPVVYDTGVRSRGTVLGGGSSLNAGRSLANGQLHQFGIVRRADAIFWYIDGITTPAATYTFAQTGYSQADLSALPIRLHQINGTTALSTAPTTRMGAVGVADTGRNSAAIADATYPWRRATVSRSGSLAVEPVQRVSYVVNASALSTLNAGILAMVAGSASRVVRIARVSAVCIAGASSTTVLKLERLSALSGGTAGTAVTGAVDTTNATNTATAAVYTATPTVTTAMVYHQKGVTGTMLTADWMFGDVPEQQPVLRGTSQWFALRNVTAIGTSGSWHITIEWTEELEAA